MFRSHEDGHNFSLSSSPQELNDISQFLWSTTTSFPRLNQPDEFLPDDDDISEDGCQLLGEKKRRLNFEQVRALEKSFESCNKLGPERKMELSRALGLQPRQITIWFQNRRARWKTKQLEKDYQILRRKIQSIKAENDDLKSQNKELQSQLMALERMDSSCGINLNRDAYEGCWNVNGSCNDQSNLNATLTDEETRTILYNPSYNKLNPINVFPDSVNPESPAANLTQPLHSSWRPESSSVIHGPGIDNPVGPASDEPIYNIFTSPVQENHHVWPWQEQ